MQTEESELMTMAGAVIGEEAHIRSSKSKGPRYESDYPVEKLDTYANLLLLCPTHHTLIDKNNGAGYPVDAVQEMKARHEGRMLEAMGPDGAEIRERQERHTVSVALWERKINLANWSVLTGWLNQPVPMILGKDLDLLVDVSRWLLRKNWDKSYPMMIRAFENLRLALEALTKHVYAHLHPDKFDNKGGQWTFEREVKKLSRMGIWDEAKYRQLDEVDTRGIFTLYGLAIEATKAVNFAIESIVLDLDPYYRFDEGVVLMQTGDGILSDRYVRLEYTAEVKRKVTPFPGVERISSRVVQLREEDLDWSAMYADYA